MTPNPVPNLSSVKSSIDKAASKVVAQIKARPETCSVLGEVFEGLVREKMGTPGITNLGTYFDGLLENANLASTTPSTTPSVTSQAPTTNTTSTKASGKIENLQDVYEAAFGIPRFQGACDQVVPEQATLHKVIVETFAAKHSLSRIQAHFANAKDEFPWIADANKKIEQGLVKVRAAIEKEPSVCSALMLVLENLVEKKGGVPDLGILFDRLVLANVAVPSSPPPTIETVDDAPPEVNQSESPIVGASGRRIALVIGNSAYKHVQALPNPVNDAEDLAAALRNLGFSVQHVGNLGKVAFDETLAEFSDRAAGADIAAVYFAGHGIEVDRVNYIVPVDATLENDRRLRFEAVSLDDVMGALDGVKGIRIVLLDACRNNPFAASMKVTSATRSIGRGLAKIEPVRGTLVSFAAKEGTVAEDGAGRNSPFAAALLANLDTPGLEIGLLFRKIRDSVLKKTNNRQEPFISASLPSNPIYLVPPK